MTMSAVDSLIRVRRAGMGDYEAMCALFDELDAFHRRGRPDMFRAFAPPARSREQVARWLAGAQSTVLVAEGGGGLVGLVLLSTRAPVDFAGAVPRKTVEVENLVVRADHRGRRVGRVLLAEAMEWARQRQATHVEVVVHDFNRDAERFYSGFCFVRSTSRLVLPA
jgi:GNAT superfamily N-acetyltransferase